MDASYYIDALNMRHPDASKHLKSIRGEGLKF